MPKRSPTAKKRVLTPKKVKKTKTPEEWGDIYKERFTVFQEFTHKLQALFLELLRKNSIDFAQIESRPKSVESFVEKIRKDRNGYVNPLEDITDLVGIRIIAYYKEDVDKIGEIIEQEFEIDWENSLNKTDALDPDRFGYLSVHYVISLSPPRNELTEWKAFSNIKAEVQVKTVLQHAWAAIDHKLRYKRASQVPRNLRRQLFCLSALLELADGEFSNLRSRTEEVEEQYTRDVKKGELNIELNLTSLEVYFEFTKHLSKWERIARQVGFRSITPVKTAEYKAMFSEAQKFAISDTLGILHALGIKTIGELDKILEDSSKWGKDALANIRKASSDEGFTPYAFPVDVITLLIFYAKRRILTKKVTRETRFKDTLIKAIEKICKK